MKERKKKKKKKKKKCDLYSLKRGEIKREVIRDKTDFENRREKISSEGPSLFNILYFHSSSFFQIDLCPPPPPPPLVCFCCCLVGKKNEEKFYLQIKTILYAKKNEF
jgi:hypothetical protein